MDTRVAGYAVAIVVVFVASCSTGNERRSTPQNDVQVSTLSNEDLASVSPALERYRREAGKRPHRHGPGRAGDLPPQPSDG
jgi:hypothetical protein